MPINSNIKSLKIGYVPLIDSAPLLVADQEGFFEDEGLNVSLSEEVGWATVRDKMIHNELDMASTLIGLPYAMHNGVGCFQTKMSIPLIMNSNGNTVCLTSDLSPEALKNPEQLSAILDERASIKKRKWTFATVNPYSTHLILLINWLNANLKNFIANIDIVFMPPLLAPEMLEKGFIDGFCTGEPWGTVAETKGVGWIAGTSLDLSKDHPEKVLAVPQKTIENKSGSVVAVGKALLKALPLCDDPSYHDKLVNLIASKPSFNMDSTVTEKCLRRQYTDSNNNLSLLHKFSGNNINVPSNEKESWTLKGLKEAGLFRKKVISTGEIMRPDMLF